MRKLSLDSRLPGSGWRTLNNWALQHHLPERCQQNRLDRNQRDVVYFPFAAQLERAVGYVFSQASMKDGRKR